MVVGIILILVIAFVIIGAVKSTPKAKGKSGEMHVHHVLAQLPEEYTVLDDVVLQTNSGTTQIDHLVVSKHGVFAIETKNYRGEIYGDDNRQQWTQIIVTDVTYRKKWYKTYSYVTKNHFYNPVKQSLAHVNAIKKALKDWPNIRVVPIVVFAGSAVLNHVTSQYHVIYIDQLLATIQGYSMPYLSDADVSRVLDCLNQKNIRQIVDDNTHVRNVHAAKQNYNAKIASGICPKCGGILVLRNGRYGRFYGCSNYPNCKFTTH